jgi:cysteine desulfurase
MIYLDHCGSTPLAPAVTARIRSLLEQDLFGNPSASHHEAGKAASDAVEDCRQSIASIVGAKPSQVIFTSGATEANNLVAWGFYLKFKHRGCRIFYGATEHKSVIEALDAMRGLPGVTIQEVPVNRAGDLNTDALDQLLINPEYLPTLVMAMHVNNEIPARHNVEVISALCARHNAFFHCDGVQGFVRERIDFSTGIYGSYVISAHKIYGPKGCGILILGDHGLAPRLSPAYRGGSQERGLRPGTLNTMSIIAGAEAISLHDRMRTSRVRNMRACAEAFVDELETSCPKARLTVPTPENAVGLVNFYIEGKDAPSLLAEVPEICLNRGASCTGAGGEQYSHVPKALGLPIEIQANTLRASFGEAITVAQSIEAARILARAAAKK